MLQVDDRVTGWEFDQPEYFYVERGKGEIRRQLQEERITIRCCVQCTVYHGGYNISYH